MKLVTLRKHASKRYVSNRYNLSNLSNLCSLPTRAGLPPSWPRTENRCKTVKVSKLHEAITKNSISYLCGKCRNYPLKLADNNLLSALVA